MIPKLPAGIKTCPILRLEGGLLRAYEDQLAEESPLEIRLEYGPAGRRQQRPVAVTMRTPGHDIELALGFLFSEGIIGKPADIRESRQASAQEDRVQIVLTPEATVDVSRLERHFYTTSSCGICGKGALELVESVSCHYPRPGHPRVAAAVLYTLPEQLRAAQSIFAVTGGLHAAGLFDARGQLLLLCEDVGRHNAVDKVIGAALRQEMLPLRDHVLMLSGRIGFELVQKAAMAGIPVIAAVGAPSTLAVQLAQQQDITLVGFLRPQRMNVYCGIERITME